MRVEPDCLFCKIVANQVPSYVIYDDARTMAFLDINPINPGHALVVPKAHSVDVFDINDDDSAAMMSTACRVAAAIRASLDIVAGINLLQSNGVGANQTVFHIHMHVIPRVHDDGLYDGLRQRPAASDELAEMHARLREALK
jgi:histidine triad (HIT) family protein